MKYYCTICSKEKRKDRELLPAIERYLSSRIKNVYEKASIDNTKFLIFSGEYGFIHPYSLIPYYDHLFLDKEIETFLPLLKQQNIFWEITDLDCFMEKEKSPGWRAYYKMLNRFAEEENIKIRFIYGVENLNGSEHFTYIQIKGLNSIGKVLEQYEKLISDNLANINVEPLSYKL